MVERHWRTSGPFRGLALAGVWITAGLLGSEAVRGEAPPLHYYYYKQAIALDVSQDEVAVLNRGAPAQPLEPAQADRPGLAPAEAPLQTPDWSYYRASRRMARPADMAAFVRQMAAGLGEGGFVSPVLYDEYGPQIIKPTINVGFRRDVHPALAEVILAESGAGEIVTRDWAGMPLTYQLRAYANNGFDVLAAANALAERDEVMWAEPGRIMTVKLADTIPNDTYFGLQWGLHNTGQSGGMVDLDMDLPEAWDIEKGTVGVVVVVLDTGTQLNHPDLNVIAGHDFTGDNEYGGAPHNQCDNHGTLVAGTISAVMNNFIGVAGVCPQCLVAPARVVRANVPCDGAGTGDADDIVDALYWTQSLNYSVTNSSLTLGYVSALGQAYTDTRAAGIVHFAATGNEGVGQVPFPANSPAVNAITGIDRNGVHHGNYGPGVTYTAPSVDIVTTDRTGADGDTPGDYETVSGTSIASPQAAGVAALMLSLDDTLTPDDIDYYLQTTCTDLGDPGYDTTWGWGLLNAHNALLAHLASVCDSGLGSCYAENLMDPGCGDSNCCLQVCDVDPYCCFNAWDAGCVQLALDLCSACGNFGAGDCHAANGTPGCDDGTCCQTVCAIDPTCCDIAWDAGCQALAEQYCTPANDDCADAEPLLAAGVHAFNSTNATEDGLDHVACANAGQSGITHDQWYCFIAPSAGEVAIRTYGLTGVDTKIAVYDGCGTCPPGDGALLACNDDAYGVLQSEVTFTAAYHGDYVIRIGTYPGADGGTGEFVIEYPAYGSDFCATAASISGTGAFAFDNSVATEDGLTHPTCPTFEGDLWFRWTAPALGQAIISTCEGTAVDTTLAVYDADGATCPPIDGDLILCNDDDCGLQSQVAIDVVGGKDYLIRLGTYPGSPRGGGTFGISLIPTPVNDDCAVPAMIGEGTYPFSTIGATTDGPALPPPCDDGAGLSFVDDIWYLYQASCNGQVTVDLCSSDYDTRLAIYDNSACPGSLLYCNDDACGLQSIGTFTGIAGSSYFIRVGGFNGWGSGTMVVTCDAPACPGDIDGSGTVDVLDLLDLLAAWGPCPAPPTGCPADSDGSARVDVVDLLALLAGWGPCP